MALAIGEAKNKKINRLGFTGLTGFDCRNENENQFIFPEKMVFEVFQLLFLGLIDLMKKSRPISWMSQLFYFSPTHLPEFVSENGKVEEITSG